MSDASGDELLVFCSFFFVDKRLAKEFCFLFFCLSFADVFTTFFGGICGLSCLLSIDACGVLCIILVFENVASRSQLRHLNRIISSLADGDSVVVISVLINGT